VYYANYHATDGRRRFLLSELNLHEEKLTKQRLKDIMDESMPVGRAD
jgi:hypothetical protein